MKRANQTPIKARCLANQRVTRRQLSRSARPHESSCRTPRIIGALADAAIFLPRLPRLLPQKFPPKPVAPAIEDWAVGSSAGGHGAEVRFEYGESSLAAKDERSRRGSASSSASKARQHRPGRMASRLRDRRHAAFRSISAAASRLWRRISRRSRGAQAAVVSSAGVRAQSSVGFKRSRQQPRVSRAAAKKLLGQGRKFMLRGAAIGSSCGRSLAGYSHNLRNIEWRKFYDPAVFEPLEPHFRRLRLTLIGAVIMLWAVSVVFRLYCLENRDSSKWLALASRQHQAKIEVFGARGSVLDAAGRALAVSVEAISVGIHPKQVNDRELTAAKLSQLLGVSKASIQIALTSERPFLFLARGVSPQIGSQITALNLPGVALSREFRRYYPQGELAAPLLGRVGRDGAGQAGVEREFDSQLSAPSLSVPVRRDARGRLVAVSLRSNSLAAYKNLPNLLNALSAEGAADAGEEERTILDASFRKEGGLIELSVDSVIQGIVEQEFDRGRSDAKARRVFGLVMDAETGEILGLGQSPRFDPNSQGDLGPDDLRNFVLQDSFEPGSTFKPVVAASALNAGKVHRGEMFDCEMGHYQFGPHMIRDVHPSGILSFDDVLIRSSNIGMTKIGMRLGKSNLYSALRSFGFGEQTGIELKGESKGILRPVDNWAEVDVATHSFGQGISVSALQIVQAYAAIANGGLLVTPTIVKNNHAAKIKRRVLREEVAHAIAEILTGVTESEDGTGRKAAIAGVRVSGKTGTAQKARADGRGYDPTKIFASFIGFVDGRDIGVDRKLVMLVAVDEPGTSARWGGTVAAPVFRRSIERVLSYLMTASDPRVMMTTADGTENRTATAHAL